jgi:hypothetical protein
LPVRGQRTRQIAEQSEETKEILHPSGKKPQPQKLNFAHCLMFLK